MTPRISNSILLQNFSTRFAISKKIVGFHFSRQKNPKVAEAEDVEQKNGEEIIVG